ncbi:putative endochitinase, partial [Stegodyphus mimosarum]
MPGFTEIAFQDKETNLDFESFQKPAVVQEQTENQRESQVVHQQPASEPEIDQISYQEKQESVGAFQEIVDDETQQVEIQSNEGYKPQQEQSQWWIPDENNSQHSEPEIQIEDNKGKPISESVKEKPILCLSEGFFSHPENCSRFIRCVRLDQSAFAIHFFECPHQLVFSEKDSSCIVSDAQSCWKNHRSKRQVRNAPLECKAEGFFRHPADCRSFYRCVKQPTGIYETHSFSCPDTLVFDEEFATCNWPEKAPPCEEIGQSYKTTGRPSYQTPTTATRPSYQPPQTSTRPPYETPQRSTKQPYQPPQRSTRPPYQPPTTATRSSYRPPVTATRPSYQPPQISTRPPYEPPQTSTKQPYQPSQRSTRPPYRPPTTAARASYQPPQKNTSKFYRSTSKPRNDFYDNLNPLIPVREYTTQRTTLNTKYATQRTTQKPKYTEKPVADNYDDQKCKSPGFYPHEKDCNKFYKCIKKSDYFVKYELSCPPNFAYDEATSRCVAERYVSSCSRRRTPYPPKQDDEEISSTESPSSDSTKQTDSDVSCTEEGYFRHPDDCNRFYRCVDYNGDGQEFVRYDFKCPEGLVFDETNSVCNWPDESAPCDGKGEKEDDKDSSSEEKESGASSTIESTTIKTTAATTESPTQEPSTTSSSSTTPEGSSTGGATTEDSGYGGSESGDSSKEPSENEQS